jgi:hypothetical protein
MVAIALPTPVRWGIVFGAPQAGLVFISAGAGALGIGENLQSNMTFGYLFLPIALAVTTALIYLAGKRAARQTRRWWQGSVAGVVAAEIGGLSITLVAWISGVANAAPPIYFLDRLLIPFVVAAVAGSVLGMIGGVVAV